MYGSVNPFLPATLTGNVAASVCCFLLCLLEGLKTCHYGFQSQALLHLCLTHLASGLVVIACSFSLLQMNTADIAILVVLRIILPGIACQSGILDTSKTRMAENFTMLRTNMSHAAACLVPAWDA